MPTTPLLLDTSVAVAVLVEDHAAHAACRAAIAGRSLGLAGHAVFETMSVMSRLPGMQRRSISSIHDAISRSFPHTRFLSPEAAREAAATMARLGIGGGSVYDGLVAAVAIEHGATLATRDQRALPVYASMGAAVVTLG